MLNINKMKFSCDPQVWGPSAWTFMHSVALCYPTKPTAVDKQHYKMFFLSLPFVLPCLKCQENLLGHLSKDTSIFENAFGSRDSLIRWVIRLHNQVNRSLHKSIVPYRQAISLHMK